VSQSPTVSVVMSVYNGSGNLRETLESVLSQESCSFEFVVVDDGSTDDSGAVLDEFAARDPRLVVIHQQNTGLTRALIRGCEAARGEFIARQDADDVSLPDRLRAQAEFLHAHPEVVAVAGGVRFAAPQGERLYDVCFPPEIEISLEFEKMRVPPLVGAMFRRQAYLAAGGFRAAFRTAQDVDMWLRLVEQGPCLAMAETYYQARMTAGGITSRRRDEPFPPGQLAGECAQPPRSGQ